ncbi:hypothetical protein HY837_02660, partial [archaeon]|nr:hypothetical protein [archaeon]
NKMEQQKKRHNPEITPEDLKNFGIVKEDSAVKAFDRNNDALEDKVKIEKGTHALREEFCQLVKKYFGRDLYFNNYYSTSGYELFESKGELKASGETNWDFSKIKKKGWFRRTEFEKYIEINLFETTIQTEDGKTDRKLLPLFRDGKFNPIKIRAYTPQALSQAKEFAEEYKEHTGQEVALIQEFSSTSLEQKIQPTTNSKPQTPNQTKGVISESLGAIPPVLACSAVAYFLGVSQCASPIVTSHVPGGLNFSHHLSAGSGLYGGYTKSTARKLMTLLTLGFSFTPEIIILYNGGNLSDIETSIGVKSAGYGLGYLISHIFFRR